MGTDNSLHAAAEKRLHDQTSFWRMLGVFVIVSLILAAIWWLSGGGYFWPIWVFFAFGIALLFAGWNAFGPRDRQPSEERIQEEMRKFR
jgi:membrane protein implicated in regulation of membrane protease activity